VGAPGRSAAIAVGIGVAALSVAACGGRTESTAPSTDALDGGAGTAASQWGEISLLVEMPALPTFAGSYVAEWAVFDPSLNVVARGTGVTGVPLSVGPVAAGTGYSLVVDTNSDPRLAAFTCSANTGPFAVASSRTVALTAELACTANLSSCGCIVATNSNCGTWETVTEPDSGTVAVGTTGWIVATANGPDKARLAYVWSLSDSSAAHLVSAPPSDAGPTVGSIGLACDAPGDVTLTLDVRDGPDDASCPSSLSMVSVAVNCVVPDGDAGPTPDAGVDAAVPVDGADATP
jgi:hypothetical protein